jgi:integrase/recombinase XerD
MARKGVYKPVHVIVGNPNDPDGMLVWSEKFLVHVRTKGQSEATIRSKRDSFRQFIEWSEIRSITSPRQVSKPILEAYQRHLYHKRGRLGRALSFGSQRRLLEPLRLFFRWLTRQNVLLANPASELEMPKTPVRLPRAILTAAEVEDILRVPDVGTPIGIRDRAVLEVLYSTGMRRGELVNLNLYDVDADRGTIMIREGKGNKDRMVPCSTRAFGWISRYVDEYRPRLLLTPEEPVLFLTIHGEPFGVGQLSTSVRRYIKQSGVGKMGSCHLFRHTCATLMYEAGCDLRLLQALLGHAKLDTTSIYTLVSIRRLMEAHARTHPGAQVERPKDVKTVPNVSEVVRDASDGLTAHEKAMLNDPDPTLDAVLEALDREAAVEEVEEAGDTGADPT